MTKDQLVKHFEGTDVKAAGIYEAQTIAHSVMHALENFLKPGLTQHEVRMFARDYMLSLGSEGWWIHNDPALVLFGDLSTLSMGGDCTPLFEDKLIAENDMVTIDVAPTIDGGWGDCSRSIFLQDGVVTPWRELKDEKLREGMALEEELHRELIGYVDENTTFEQLHAHIDAILTAKGYKNLDFLGNFGHTVDNDESKRTFIEKGETKVIAAYNKPITFEPHICKIGENTGFKYENMYVFYEGRLHQIP